MGVVWGGNTITTNLKEAMFEHYTYSTTVTYLCKKFKWTTQDIKRIAWNSLDCAKRKLLMSCNTFVSKVLFDKLPIAEWLNFFQ